MGAAKPRFVLTPFQEEILQMMAEYPLFKRFTFTGGTALAAVYLQHRISEDLDFFCLEEFEPQIFSGWFRHLSRRRIKMTQDRRANRFRLFLERASQTPVMMDFVYHPFEPAERPTSWRRLHVDSFLDIAINKTHAISSRLAAKDYVDLYFIFPQRPDLTWSRLLELVRLKIDVHLDPLAYAEKLAQAKSFKILPILLKPLPLATFHKFYLDASKQLARQGWDE